MAVTKIVAVTGANGYVASWLVKVLLERGYNVRGTVRNPDDPAKVRHLLELPGAKERLTLHKADLLDEGAFDDVFVGVEGVFHLAQPTRLGPDEDGEKDMVYPAVQGTINVLSSAAKAGTVKRVVYTSSHGAVSISEAATYPEDPNVVVDESWWSDVEWARKRKMWYMVSKVQAEQAAWDFMKEERNFDLVVVNSAFTLGPVLPSSLNSSCEKILQFLDGTMKVYPYFTFAFVHLNDFAFAQILVYETPSAQGRYCLAEKAMHATEVMDLLRAIAPECPIPDKCMDSRNPVSPIFGSDKIKKLGLVYTPTEKILKEFVAILRERKWLKY